MSIVSGILGLGFEYKYTDDFPEYQKDHHVVAFRYGEKSGHLVCEASLDYRNSYPRRLTLTLDHVQDTFSVTIPFLGDRHDEETVVFDSAEIAIKMFIEHLGLILAACEKRQRS